MPPTFLPRILCTFKACPGVKQGLDLSQHTLSQQEKLIPGQQPHQLKQLGETRWACQHDAIHAIKATYTSLISTLEEVAEDRSDAVEARGLLYQVKTFHFIICLSTFDLPSITNALSKTLQDPKLDLAVASEAKWSGI